MKKFRFISLLAAGLFCSSAFAQLNIRIGEEPNCPYGYFDYEPYHCAPHGYYGPEWFGENTFLGAGPWHRGHENFKGQVDNRYDPKHGYNGPLPERGDERFNHFRGNETRRGRGHRR